MVRVAGGFYVGFSVARKQRLGSNLVPSDLSNVYRLAATAVKDMRSLERRAYYNPQGVTDSQGQDEQGKAGFEGPSWFLQF